jgi:RNA polymerase sigma-70 factor (ECF subfamily)
MGRGGTGGLLENRRFFATRDHGRRLARQVGEPEEQPLDKTAKLDEFLRGVEKQAYVMARTLTGDAEEAMDVVQDSMLRFSRRYTGRPEEEWRPIFFRILINRGRDFQRRRAVRSRFMNWFRNDDLPDPVDTAPAAAAWDPLVAVTGMEALNALEHVVAELPARQREAFVLRCLEDHDVATTAGIMGCSEGSVKTHYSRALTALRSRLEEHHDG